jgi:DNA-binding NarL/FixJ family response regulator
VDDHPALLEQARRLLSGEFDVVGTLPDGAGLSRAIEDNQPDAIVLDISLPGASGLDLARQLRDANCSAAIVFLTVHCDADYARAALAAGAIAYVVKSRMATDLIAALRQALGGRRFVSPCPELEGLI